MIKYAWKIQRWYLIWLLLTFTSIPIESQSTNVERNRQLRKTKDNSKVPTAVTNITSHDAINEDDVTSSRFLFSQEMMQLTQKAVHLSNIAYDSDPATSSLYFQYDRIDVFTESVDQAILVKTGNYCIAAYRGTDISSWQDIYQNLMMGNTPICSSNHGGICCNAERGFYDAYDRGYRADLESKIRFCAQQCTQESIKTSYNKTEIISSCPTVVLTGHSQGGSVATIASITLSDLSPVVITFGQPPTIDRACPLVNSSRIYRFENSRIGRRGTTYDPVPYLPYSAAQYGYQIMLGEDATGVAYIGQSEDEMVEFVPWDSANFFATHRLTPEDVGFVHRIDSLAAATKYVQFVRTTGFVDGTSCSKGVECASKSCLMERCVTA